MRPGPTRIRRRVPGSELRQRGSVLVPVVAAMLLLSLSGIALSELFSAQRHQAVLELESSRAQWIAEAGVRHAAYLGTGLPAPVPFGGGSYTVSKTGNTYVSTGLESRAARVASAAYTPLVTGVPTSPLDESASSATAFREDRDKLELDLIGISPNAAIIDSFELSADVPTRRVDKLKLDGEDIWQQDGVLLPTGPLALNEGELHEQTILAGEALPLRVEFDGKPSGTVTYTLTLFFTNGSSSTLVFTIDW